MQAKHLLRGLPISDKQFQQWKHTGLQKHVLLAVTYTVKYHLCAQSMLGKNTFPESLFLPWKMILVRSRGAITVLATAPANAPHRSESRAVHLGLRSCLDTQTRWHITSHDFTHVTAIESDPAIRTETFKDRGSHKRLTSRQGNKTSVTCLSADLSHPKKCFSEKTKTNP